MKITILSAAYPYRGGLAHFTYLLYKELLKEHEVNVVTFKRQYPEFLFPGKSQVEPDIDEEQRIPTERLIDSVNPINWILTGIKIKNSKPDLLLINFWLPFFGPSFGTIAKIVKGNRKTRIISITHNVKPHEKRVGDRMFTRYLFSAVDNFILLSKRLEQDLKMMRIDARFKTLFHPVYSIFGNPVPKDTARRHLNIEGEKVILFFGFIREYKGLDNLLKAFAILKEKINIKLVVAGEYYHNEEHYTTLIDELKISDGLCLFNNFIPTTDVKYFFSAADVVILPYNNATQSGIVQIANNFNKPVIATDVGAMSEAVLENKTGFLVVKQNPDKLAETILKFYNENKEAEFVENIKIESERFSWANFVNGIMSVLEIK
jgi:glycosyltransferase involved in cell wall biosynthesis